MPRDLRLNWTRSASTPEALVECRDRRARDRRPHSGAPGTAVARRCGRSARVLREAGRARPTDARRVIAETDAAGILVQVGFQRRFDAGYRAAREAVASGAVGDVLVLRAATHDPARRRGVHRDVRRHLPRLAHPRLRRDPLRHRPRDRGGVCGRRGPHTEWFADHDDVDVATAMLRLDDGTLAIVSGTRHDPLATTCGSKSSAPRTASPSASTLAAPTDRSRTASRQANGLCELHGAVQAAYRAELETSSTRARTGSKAPARSRTRAPRSPLRSLRTARAAERAPVRV